MTELLAQQGIISGIVFGIITLARQLPVYEDHAEQLRGYVPFVSFLMMVVATIVMAVQRDLDVEATDVVYFALLTSGTPTLFHEGKNGATQIVKNVTNSAVTAWGLIGSLFQRVL